jgi:AcrR family transcriptional regulator
MPRITVKDKIVATASALFYENGYNLTGIDQVIEEADIARGSLYYHFESKTDLLLACLDTFQENWFKGLEEFLKPITDPKKKVLAIFDYRIMQQQKTGLDGCLFIKINNETGKTDTRILERVQANKDKLKACIRKLTAQCGHSHLLTDEEFSHMLYLLMEGAVTSTSIYKDTNEIKKAKKIAGKFL